MKNLNRLPGGRVDPPESFAQAALRETLEEGGININLKGILRIETLEDGNYIRVKVVYYAEPVDEN